MSTKARFVFIGNIPYGLTEEQITGIFGTAGQVAHFRLVHDKDTGRPKGFGFLEYADPDAASTAVRNLDQYEVMGRKLRVDFTNESGASEGAIKDQGPAMPGGTPDGAPAGQSGGLPPLPPGQDLPQGVSCEDAISRTLAAVPGPQLLDILSTMKGVVASEPQKATELLSKAPQLSYAIFQSLLLLGLVDTQVLQGVLGQAQQSHAGNVAPHQAPAPPGSLPPVGQSQFAPPGQYPGQPMQPPHMNTMTPPVQSQYQQQPPPPPPVAAAPPAPASQQQEVLVQKIMSMSQQELDALAPEVRNQVYQLRQQFMGGQA